MEVDKHKVQAEAQLAAITLEYQKVRARDEKMRQEMLTVQAAKEGVFYFVSVPILLILFFFA